MLARGVTFLHEMVDWGVKPSDTPASRKRMRMCNHGNQLVFNVHIFYIVLFSFMDVPLLIGAHIFYLLLSVLSLYLGKSGRTTAAKFIILTSGNLTMFFNATMVGQQAGIEFFYAVTLMAPFLLFSRLEKWIVWFWIAVPVIFLGGNFTFALFISPQVTIEPHLLRLFWHANFVTVIFMTTFLCYYMITENDVAMEAVESLKVQQDGDYFLTSLISQPLSRNANHSEVIQSDIYISQKKKVSFKNRLVEIGGDLCITGNLQFMGEKHLFFVNADAMGKSLQGASGAIAFGAYINSLLKSGRGDSIDDIPKEPAKWLGGVYRRLCYLFDTFEGSMAVSCIIGTVNEQNGVLTYANIEHPRPVLYRDGVAQFCGQSDMHKIGHKVFEPAKPIFRRIKLEPGDILIMGSDGKDDIRNASGQINSDEAQFLSTVESSQGQLDIIVNKLRATGELIDDLSLLRIEYRS